MDKRQISQSTSDHVFLITLVSGSSRSPSFQKTFWYMTHTSLTSIHPVRKYAAFACTDSCHSQKQHPDDNPLANEAMTSDVHVTR